MDHGISALLKKRDELATDMRQLEVELSQVKDDIGKLEAAIKVLDPACKIPEKRRKRRTKNQFFAQGEATRFVLDTLREATEPLSTTDLAEMAAQAKGLDPAKIDFKAMKACILTVLSRKRLDGVAVERGRAKDGAIKWELV